MSAIQVIHHLSHEQNDNCRKGSCCRRKTKMTCQNDFLHNQQSLPLMKQKNCYTNTDNKQFSENYFRHNDYQS